MTKREVLEILSRTRQPMFPDDVSRQLSTFARWPSVYSYLFRIREQALLLRRQIAGRVAYQLSRRGRERLDFFQASEASKLMIRAAKTSRI